MAGGGPAVHHLPAVHHFCQQLPLMTGALLLSCVRKLPMQRSARLRANASCLRMIHCLVVSLSHCLRMTHCVSV